MRRTAERELARAEIEEMSARPDPVGQVKDFRLPVVLPTAEDDEMMPTMKSRCRNSGQKHKVPMDETY